MLPRRRMLLVLVVAGLVAAPAAILAGLCLGNACRRSDAGQARVPFCSLPAELRSSIASGFRDTRSPHVLAVSGPTPVGDESNGLRWPSIKDVHLPDIPMVFAGSGVATGAEVPTGAALDSLAPTLAEIIGLRRPHPGVRTGEALSGIASGEPPRLAVLVVWKNVSSRELKRRPQTWPVLRGLMEDGAATMEATAGSLPTDPAAILATIGTGALPLDHGITGSFIRNDQGDVVVPWSEDSPFSVVAALGDDLDEIQDQTPRIGLVGTDERDQGLVGGNWYLDHDKDDTIIEPEPASQAEKAATLLSSGYGGDTTTDLLAVAMEGPIPELDTALGTILESAKDVSGGSFVMASTATGSAPFKASEAFPSADVEQQVDAEIGTNVISATTPGGVFIDQEAMTRTGLSDDRVVTALRHVEDAGGNALFEDVFPAIAVTFAKYC
jgi:hypothetical protein